MRYVTEGETYIIPLFFSLMASYGASRKQSAFGCSMLAALACLFHQIHVFWWMGLALFFWKETEKSERLKIMSLYLFIWCMDSSCSLSFSLLWNVYGLCLSLSIYFTRLPICR